MSNRSGKLCFECDTDHYTNLIIYRSISTKYNKTSKYNRTSTLPGDHRITQTPRFNNYSRFNNEIQDEYCQHGEIDYSETSKDSKRGLFALAPRLYGEVCPHSYRQCPSFSTQHYARHVSLSSILFI